MSKDRRTGVVGARPATQSKRDPEPLIGAPVGLAAGVWPGWDKCRRWGLVGVVNSDAVLRAVRAAREAVEKHDTLNSAHVGHLLAELDRVSSSYYQERDGNALLKDQLSRR